MRRDRKITIQRAADGATNGFNEPADTWSDLCEEWASRNDVSDAEKTSSGMEHSVLLSRFVVRSNSNTRTVTGQDRISGEGGIWNILGVKEMGRNEDIEITAERRSD